MNIQAIQPYITAAKDCVLFILAVIGSIVSILGLYTWRKQIKGKTEYDLARRFLRAAYKLRDAIAHVRNPFMSGAEMAASLADEKISKDPPEEMKFQSEKGFFAAYQKRWEQVQEAISDLSIETLEAEVLWGSKIHDLLKPIYDLVSDLRFAIEDHFMIKRGELGDISKKENTINRYIKDILQTCRF